MVATAEGTGGGDSGTGKITAEEDVAISGPKSGVGIVEEETSGLDSDFASASLSFFSSRSAGSRCAAPVKATCGFFVDTGVAIAELGVRIS
eukprot:5003171-Amphidinium_carterae.1